MRRYDGPVSGDDTATAMALDAQGNVYVTGRSDGGASLYDYATIKYNPDGKALWVKRYGGPGNRDDSASAIALDGQGSVYLGGTSAKSDTGQDYLIIKYIQSPRLGR